MLLQAGSRSSPAQTSASPARAQESTERKADSGKKWPESLARFDPLTCSWRTHQRLLDGEWELFAATWPRWGMMRDGELWEVATSAWTKKARGSGYLRRPQAKDGRGFYCISRESAVRRQANPKRQLMLIHQLLLNGSSDMKTAVANPPFWESLMELPIGWTDLQPLETHRCRLWLASHGVCSPKD